MRTSTYSMSVIKPEHGVCNMKSGKSRQITERLVTIITDVLITNVESKSVDRKCPQQFLLSHILLPLRSK
jgi:hypothetical protein